MVSDMELKCSSGRINVDGARMMLCVFLPKYHIKSSGHSVFPWMLARHQKVREFWELAITISEFHLVFSSAGLLTGAQMFLMTLNGSNFSRLSSFTTSVV